MGGVLEGIIETGNFTDRIPELEEHASFKERKTSEVTEQKRETFLRDEDGEVHKRLLTHI